MKNKSIGSIRLLLTISALILTNSILAASEIDDRIEASAKKSYVYKTFLLGDTVKTESKEGVVTLSGTVSQDFHKSLAEDTVGNLAGVKRVKNQLVVKVEPIGNPDTLLGSKVKSVLRFHRNVSGKMTEVIALDGVVTLQGPASSQAQKDLATEYAKDVEGVKQVKNEMTVGEANVEADRTIGEKIDDASIAAQIKASLLTHRSTNALKTQVQSRDGVVTVSGIAKNPAEKALVTKLVSDISGVTSVTNNMSITE